MNPERELRRNQREINRYQRRLASMAAREKLELTTDKGKRKRLRRIINKCERPDYEPTPEMIENDALSAKKGNQ